MLYLLNYFPAPAKINRIKLPIFRLSGGRIAVVLPAVWFAFSTVAFSQKTDDMKFVGVDELMLTGQGFAESHVKYGRLPAAMEKAFRPCTIRVQTAPVLPYAFRPTDHNAQWTDHFAQWIDHCAQWTDHCAQWIDHFAQWIDHCAQWIDHNAQWTDHNAQWTDHCAQWTDHCTQWIDHCAQWIDHNAQWIDHFAQWIDHFAQWIDHNAQWIDHNAQWIDHCARWIDHNARWIDHNNSTAIAVGWTVSGNNTMEFRRRKANEEKKTVSPHTVLQSEINPLSLFGKLKSHNSSNTV
ncbi:MAG: hypothetical protein LBS79_01555 [Tannerella sp.]|nr:hypothetical protein [Tannerella sp.]